MQRILEEDLQLPALYLINLKNGKITTSELSQLLRSLLNPTEEDLEILEGRKDDKFSQIVRNLTAAERPFVKKGLIRRESGRNSPLFITDEGKRYLKDKYSLIPFLASHDFKCSDIIDCIRSTNAPTNVGKKIHFFSENATIQEGSSKIIQSKKYARSNSLRNCAIEYYSVNGRVKCQACCFDFEEFYGNIGKGFIEIHHQKPIFMFDECDLKKTIQNALENVIPICSNCHRVIHKNKDSPLGLEELKMHINEDLFFCSA